jgi:hypothetical protein
VGVLASSLSHERSLPTLSYTYCLPASASNASMHPCIHASIVGARHATSTERRMVSANGRSGLDDIPKLTCSGRIPCLYKVCRAQ